ncbi:probable G-protein coupled receptor 160 [Brachyistius frenatus]|uniref:probable G-protein coupled receptor 160 n=1 Tax=Brachyistius frenatus TaxID=100188 RepID=UPI0037E8D06C
MFISITSVLLGLGVKCLLNWTLVFLQRSHICRSFLGLFGVSLTVVDTAVTLTVTTLCSCSNGFVVLLGLKLTRYHVCLLVQILGEVYRVLQWPVIVAAGLDHFCIITRRLQGVTFRAKWIVYSCVAGFLWNLAALYVFLLSDVVPVLEDVSHHQMHRCWVLHTARILSIAMLLLLILGCAALHAGRPLVLRCNVPQLSLNEPPLKNRITSQSQTRPRRSFVHQTLRIFLNTWTPFLVFLAVFLLLPVGIPSYLDLNVAWLCFLNSLLIAVVLCAASQLSQGLAALPPDIFCEWKFNF